MIALTFSTALFGCYETSNDQTDVNEALSDIKSLPKNQSTTELAQAELSLKKPDDESSMVLARKIGLQETLVYLSHENETSKITYYVPDSKTDSVYGPDMYSGWIHEEHLIPSYYEYSKEHYRSAKYQFVVDCKKETYTIRSVSKFSGNLLSGKTITTSTIGEYESTRKMLKTEPTATSTICLKAICSNSKVWLSDSEQFRPALCDETLENNQCLYDWIEK